MPMTVEEAARLVAKAIFDEITDLAHDLTSEREGLSIDPAALVLNASARLPPELGQSILTSPDLRSAVRIPHHVNAESHLSAKLES